MGGGDHYDILRLDPVTRERLIATGQAQLHKVATNGISAFHNALRDDYAEADRTGPQRAGYADGWYNLALDLAAIHARDGDGAGMAAQKAFAELIGGRYTFKDTWRIPNETGIPADDVQRGTLVARRKMADGELARPPIDDEPGRSDANASDLRDMSRDGHFVTSYDEKGLNFITRAGNFARSTEDRGKFFFLSWAELAKLGQEGGAILPPRSGATRREFMARHGVPDVEQ